MPPKITIQSAGRPTVASRGGGMGGRAGRGGGRTRGHSGEQGDGRIDGQCGQVGDGSRGCTYKECLACNPKEYDGKGGAIVYTRWIEKMELLRGETLKSTRGREATVGMPWEDFKTLTREEFCPSNEMKKLETELWNHAMVGGGHAAYTDRFHELARLVPHLVTQKELKTIQKAIQIAGTLTDEAFRNGSIENNPERRGNGGEPSKDRNVRDDNKRTRTRNAFATTAYLVRGG
nr:reverse transcriptase domain-containing protein [Tanacetum cinerariifolium]